MTASALASPNWPRNRGSRASHSSGAWNAYADPPAPLDADRQQSHPARGTNRCGFAARESVSWQPRVLGDAVHQHRSTPAPSSSTVSSSLSLTTSMPRPEASHWRASASSGCVLNDSHDRTGHRRRQRFQTFERAANRRPRRHVTGCSHRCDGARHPAGPPIHAVDRSNFDAIAAYVVLRKLLMSVSYVLPIRTPNPTDGEMTEYLSWLAPRVELIVVDGSSADVFSAHERRWAGIRLLHVAPDQALRGLANGKVAGVLSGLRRASHELIIVADDDVRYDEQGCVRSPAPSRSLTWFDRRTISRLCRGTPASTPRGRCSTE